MTTNSKKTALITGASRGIGRATAQALANAGIRVIIHYGRSGKEADSLLSEIALEAATPIPYMPISPLQTVSRSSPDKSTR